MVPKFENSEQVGSRFEPRIPSGSRYPAGLRGVVHGRNQLVAIKARISGSGSKGEAPPVGTRALEIMSAEGGKGDLSKA